MRLRVRESPQRLDAAKAMLEEMGGTFRDFFMTMGQHDLVLIQRLPTARSSPRWASRGARRASDVDVQRMRDWLEPHLGWRADVP